MLTQLEQYLLDNWSSLPWGDPRPRRLSFLGQGTGVSKACFFVFADDEPRPRYIVKAPRSPVYNEELMSEVESIERVRRCVTEALRATLPGPMHVHQMSGTWLVVEPVLPGLPLDSLMVAGKGLDRGATKVQLELAFDWLVRMQGEAPHWSNDLDDTTIQRLFVEPLESVRIHTDVTAAEDRFLQRLVAESHSLRGRSLPLYLYHGDYRAGNILIHQGRIAVLDWQSSRPLDLPLLDWYSFVFRLYSRGIGLPDIDGTLEAYRQAWNEVFVQCTWFSGLVADYTRAYCQRMAVDEAYLSLLFSMFVVDNINKFRTFLAARAQRGYLYLLRAAPTSQRSYGHQLRRQAYNWLLGDLVENTDRPVTSEPAKGSLPCAASSWRG